MIREHVVQLPVYFASPSLHFLAAHKTIGTYVNRKNREFSFTKN
jgi:hypothetical protein